MPGKLGHHVTPAASFALSFYSRMAATKRCELFCGDMFRQRIFSPGISAEFVDAERF